ncbi:hypothetical protein GGI11_000251 [Coemansia sp. RSA 2049]|nr:hypothetical protein H4217_008355 [Coemansia sp. RSA 1939]KAJ2525164.1 hypothetical protein GGI11_000251 [Coemansia sp. RSA 2049]KAJ2593692.1 hypothetical protein EV177_008508 [Coemansia sp. RSA 1804]KAJ2681371.1 hypothetical protein GGH99_005241 [Coemansia sp. RSA 1285]
MHYIPPAADSAETNGGDVRGSTTATTTAPATTSPDPHTVDSSSAESLHHRLKDVAWWAGSGRRDVRIATQNENGPCPLLALANVLALEGRISLAGAARPSVSDQDLVSVLANHLLVSSDTGSSNSSTVGEADVAAALTLLPSLRTGLDVDLQFGHIRDFAEGPAVRLFRAFGVALVHGWVVDADAEPDVAQTLARDCGNGYLGAAEYVIQQTDDGGAQRIRRWLSRTASQLTDHGLHLLGTQLPDSGLCVMFRNNHFSVLFKRAEGELFLLCTDDGVAGDDRIVWESLRDVRQMSSEFVDAQFRPIVPRASSVAAGGAESYQQQQQHQQQHKLMHSSAADYVRQMSAPPQAAAAGRQIDSDFAFALQLQQQEEAASRRAAQVRQDSRMPPGMAAARGDQLYGVPEASSNGSQPQAQPQLHLQSPANADKKPSKSIEDRCVVM